MVLMAAVLAGERENRPPVRVYGGEVEPRPHRREAVAAGRAGLLIDLDLDPFGSEGMAAGRARYRGAVLVASPLAREAGVQRHGVHGHVGGSSPWSAFGSSGSSAVSCLRRSAACRSAAWRRRWSTVLGSGAGRFSGGPTSGPTYSCAVMVRAHEHVQHFVQGVGSGRPSSRDLGSGSPAAASTASLGQLVGR